MNDDEPEDLFFSMEDVHHMNHQRSQIELLQAQAAIASLREALARMEVTIRVRDLQEERARILREVKSREARLSGLSRELGNKYDVDMTSIVYDDQTGKVSPV